MSKEHYRRVYFEQQEAEAKVGQRIQTLVDFAGVVKGTTGQVVAADPAGFGKGYSLAIQWDLPRQESASRFFLTGEDEGFLLIAENKPLVDWLSRDEYDEFLEALPNEAIANPSQEEDA